MKEEEKLLCNYMADFFEKNFNKIVYNIEDSNFSTKKNEFIEQILEDSQNAVWALEELTNWGMDKPYLRELYIEQNMDFKILKINDKYIKLTQDKEFNYFLNFVEPKTKTIIYFE